MRAGVGIAVWCAVLLGLTVVLVDSVTPVELAVAGVAAVGGAVAAQRIRSAADAGFSGSRRAARAVLLLPWAVVRGLAVLLAALARRPGTAVVRRVRLAPGADPGWAGALLAASPDTCVVDVPGDDAVVVHALRPEAGPVEEIVARPGGER
ncbi:hypothetical protein [Kitasatospora purpeofusca]|uniref:hypothetical protein n=1 Tax=Kitasatospora purpeofusca TaxID=67352 RepID=UPI002A5A71E9|nr:hypothetical protein [Kitasatospora purpeofusca]MDY0811365.1 hypothetical protein [Kitasatospora purpeofusca]